jgi:hypothetical protein
MTGGSGKAWPTRGYFLLVGHFLFSSEKSLKPKRWEISAKSPKRTGREALNPKGE